MLVESFIACKCHLDNPYSGMLSFLNQRPVQAVASASQKDQSEAALAAALAVLERHQARLLRDPVPAATGNASSCAGDAAETPPNLHFEAPAKLMEAQRALVAADEQAMSSRQALQIAARSAPHQLL